MGQGAEFGRLWPDPVASPRENTFFKREQCGIIFQFFEKRQGAPRGARGSGAKKKNPKRKCRNWVYA